MDSLIEAARNGSVVDQALFLMAVGLVGVFAVLTVFFFIIRFMEKTFKEK